MIALRNNSKGLKGIIVIIPMLAIIFFSVGCNRKVYIPVESVRTDSLYIERARVDSIVLRDSVAVIQMGDTIYITKFRDRYRYKNRTDTLYKVTTDTIKVKELIAVDRKLSFWERLEDYMGLIFFLALVFFFVVYWIKGGRK